MAELSYTTRSIRQRGTEGMWEVTLSHRNPLTGEVVRTYHKVEPKTSSSRRTIPLTAHTFQQLKAMRAQSRRQMVEFGLAGDPYILGTQEPESRQLCTRSASRSVAYNPTQLGKDFAAFCKMNGFSCTFHDLRHTFATMMIAGGTDVRTVASYLGHASVSMTLNIYADVDPDAKKAAVSKVQDCFDMDFDMDFDLDDEPAPIVPPASGISFTVEQLEAMLQAAKAQQAMVGVA